MLINTSIINENFEFVEEANLLIEKKLIKEVSCGFASGAKNFKNYLVMPSLINAHTHIGDSLFKGAADGLSVDSACGPEGLKWKLYKNAKREDLIRAMRASAKYMLNSGILCFSDFREFGIPGINELKEAVSRIPIKSVILGRELSIDEISECSGLGLNVYQLNENPDFLKILQEIKNKNKILAVHAGEVEGEIKTALKYNPGIIIHATKATPEEIKEISGKNISVVCCPRSNAALGVGIPKIKKMLDLNINACLGTDNVMLNSPDMWREMEFTAKFCGINPGDVLKMATINAASEFNLNSGIIEKNRNADLIFIDRNSINLKFNKDWISVIVNRCNPGNVRKVMISGRFVVDKDNKDNEI
ncbi:hypothetical protein BEH94_03470 [Candidatus Altiarchaeales archaeon WOR_SM1_SCG]|nr:hypothetical protein BEH94_03470 [Candidatus Altiarchaeales archaeon WOR_SM1_SCG]